LGNPKVILFYLGFLPTFIDLQTLTAQDILIIAIIISTVLGVTMLGYAYMAAKIALESDESSRQLRQRVTSPGGTTEKAIQTFEEGRFKQLVAKALHAARDRSVEMSKQLGEK
jgi:hypothetical protein